MLKRLLRADLARGAVVAIALAGLIALAATLMSARKVIQRAHGGALLLGPLMFRWTTCVRLDHLVHEIRWSNGT